MPQARSRATVDGMPEAAQPESAVHLPGDRVTVAGVYFPFGKIARRDESWFEVGAVLPELTGYEAGGVWVRETGR